MASIDASVPSPQPSKAPAGKLRLGSLTALVIGMMVGSGVFSLPQNMATGAGPLAILIGWGTTTGIRVWARPHFPKFGLDCMEMTDEVFGSKSSIVFDQAETGCI